MRQVVIVGLRIKIRTGANLISSGDVGKIQRHFERLLRPVEPLGQS